MWNGSKIVLNADIDQLTYINMMCEFAVAKSQQACVAKKQRCIQNFSLAH